MAKEKITLCRCGQKLDADFNYCPKCGTALMTEFNQYVYDLISGLYVYYKETKYTGFVETFKVLVTNSKPKLKKFLTRLADLKMPKRTELKLNQFYTLGRLDENNDIKFMFNFEIVHYEKQQKDEKSRHVIGRIYFDIETNMDDEIIKIFKTKFKKAINNKIIAECKRSKESAERVSKYQTVAVNRLSTFIDEFTKPIETEVTEVEVKDEKVEEGQDGTTGNSN